MTYEVQEKYHLIEYDGYDLWERIDRVQKYKNHTILSVTFHYDSDMERLIRHRIYRVIKPNGDSFEFYINKRGGNIKELKKYIDLKEKRD